MLKFLVVTDLHYSPKNDPDAERQNHLSAKKLGEVIAEHGEGCDFIVNLGDTADAFIDTEQQRTSMVEIADILKSSKLPVYCAIGNHDTSLPKTEVTEILGMPHRYYSFEKNGYTCIFLDANMNSVDEPYPESEIKWAYTHIDKKQLDWAEDVIENSKNDVIVFCHELFKITDFEEDGDHVIKNCDEAMRIFEKTGKVKAVFSGHFHFGDYVNRNSIPYITLNALCMHKEKSCAVVTIDNNKINVEGFGLQKSLNIG